MQLYIFACNVQAMEEASYPFDFGQSQEGSLSIRIGKSIQQGNLIPLQVEIQKELVTKVSTEPTVKLKRENHYYRLVLPDGNELYLILSCKKELTFYHAACREFAVGRAEFNTIYVKEISWMSACHLKFLRNQTEMRLEVMGENGVYINRTHYPKGTVRQLAYGDELMLFGVCLVYLGKKLAIISYNQTPQVSLPKLTMHDFFMESDTEQDTEPVMEPDTEPARREETVKNSVYVRLLPDLQPIELEAPLERRMEEQQSMMMTIGPAFTMTIPMLLGLVLSVLGNKEQGGSMNYAYSGMITSVCSALMGVSLGVMNAKRRKRMQFLYEEQRQNAYYQYIEDARGLIQEKAAKNRAILFHNYPSITELSKMGTGRESLKNLKISDETLTVRLGLGSRPFDAPIIIPKERFSIFDDHLKKLPQQLKEEYEYLEQVPIVLDLKNADSVCNFCSTQEDMLKLLTLYCLQLVLFHTKEQLRCFAMFQNTALWQEALETLKWIPHFYYLGRRNIFKSVVGEQALCELMREDKPLVIFTDYEPSGQSLPPNIPQEKVKWIYLLQKGQPIPGGCRVLLKKKGAYCTLESHQAEGITKQTLLYDDIPDETAKSFAKKLCEVDFQEEKSREIPKKVTLFELLMEKQVDVEAVRKRWGQNSAVHTLEVPVGMGEGGKIIRLNAHEQGHGPHGLIAGTTGSGKSELLQTFILTLSCYYPPWEVGFFLIDYKGGGMADLFSKLPHVLGSISNLSGDRIGRAMVSIRSENLKRQELFARHHVNQIGKYQQLYKEKLVQEPLPHIFIIIDEFAELKREQPDFMQQLISVAQVGRSLGVHLVLATQRPCGTVDDQILGNTRFRICLRVQDKQDSLDILHKADAAFLKQPGRAYLQVGNDEIYEQFQSGYTMAEGTQSSASKAVLLLGEDGQACKENRRETNQAPTQMSIALRAIEQAYLQEACKKDACELPKKLWLPPLPEELELSAILGEDNLFLEHIPVGLYDQPTKQKQAPVCLNLNTAGHTIICGNHGSGKSTFLQTFLYGFIMSASKEEIWIYILDFHGSLLKCFAGSCLVGAYLDEATQKVQRLFLMLQRIMQERKKSGVKLPCILVVINGMGEFMEATKGAWFEILQELMKGGESTGIYFYVTAMFVGASEMPGRLFELFSTGICFRMDRFKCMEVLRISQLPFLCDALPDGRAVFTNEEEAFEVQIAVVKAGDRAGREQFISSKIRERNEADRAGTVPPIPEIPKNPTYRQMLSQQEAYFAEGWEKQIPVGYELESGQIFRLSYEKVRYFFLTGREGSGRHNLAGILEKELKKRGETLIVAEQIEQLKGQRKGCCLMILDFDSQRRLVTEPFFEEIREESVGFHLGGNLDRQELWDVSFIPYNKKEQMKRKGIAQVFCADRQSVEILVPLDEQEERGP